jgi:hypothetical protein
MKSDIREIGGNGTKAKLGRIHQRSYSLIHRCVEKYI